VLTITCSCLVGLTKNFFEDRAAGSVLSRVIGRFKIRPAGDIGRLGVHHLADIEDLQVVPRFDRGRLDGFEIRPPCPHQLVP